MSHHLQLMQDALAGGGEMGKLIREFDWSKTSLGAAADWPQSLKTVIRIMLDSRYAMWLGWGEDLVFFYNDAYANMTLGPKHPWALGRKAKEVWSEIWDDIGPRAESVLETGKATWDEGLLLFLQRSGFSEETYHTFSYSPVPNDAGGIGGMLCVVTEDTERTIGERRLRTLRELASRTSDESRSAEDACHSAAGILSGNPQDIPFALLYLLDSDTQQAHLVASTGLEGNSPISPPIVDLKNASGPWPLADVAKTGRFAHVLAPGNMSHCLVLGAWSTSVREVLVLPMTKAGQTRPAGFVVCGLNPRRPFDENYRGFMELIAAQIAIAVANARAIEEERRRAAALAELDRVKTAFFSNVSHEFRTPLTLMLGPIEDILITDSEDDLPIATRRKLEVVNRNGLRLLRLVNTLLDFSRIEAGRVRARFQPTDLASYTRDLASNFRSACERAGLQLTTNCEELSEPVYIDRGMWEKIVLNLLSNAFKFTFDGAITVRLLQTDAAAVLQIEDTGTGVPAEEMPRLFERFHRIENARARTHEGSGIGLALVQELVLLHGGSISAESVLGKGTIFSIVMPFGRAHLPQEQISEEADLSAVPKAATSFVEEALRWLPGPEKIAKRSRSETPLESEHSLDVLRAGDGSKLRLVLPRILVADDNSDMRDYIVRLLAENYSVQAVSNGEAALAAVRTEVPDLVLSDVMMPHLDGFGLLRALREDPRTADVPVILLSARAGEESRIEGVEAGADDYIVKPFSARELLARVSGLLQITSLRQEARNRLRESELRYRTLFETMNEGFAVHEIIYDETGKPWDLRYLEVNPAFEQHTSLKREDIIGRTARELFPKAEAVWFERYGRVAETGVSDHFRARFGALEKWFEVKVYRTEPKRVATVFTDITDQQRLEQERQMFVSLAQNSHEFVGICDLSFRPLFVNQAGLRLVGLDGTALPSDVSGTDFFFPEDRSFVESEFVPKVLREGHGEVEIRFRHFKTSEPIWMIYNLIVINDESGTPQALGTVSLNISERKESEAALKDADRRKDEFLATLAHELRNPLAPLRNCLELMRLSAGKPQIVENARVLMERQLGHMVRLVDDLLDMSRISRGLIELQKAQVSLEKILRSAIETSRPLIEEAGHFLAFSMPSEPITLDADSTRLAQVFANLLNNAAKYTRRGGKIRLTAERQGSEAVISVQDNGVGIPLEMLPKVFDMFTQVDRTLEGSQGGLGIGLTLVRRLVQAHGGTVEARSSGRGAGSEFVVRLPIGSYVAEEATAARSKQSARASLCRRVLVVDDNLDAATSLALLLKLMGNDTEMAHDGAEAIEKAESFLPDMVLLDIGMPKVNGYEAARRIRQQPWGKKMILVALTGWGQDEDRRRSEEVGFNHHLTKPVDPDMIEKLLEDIPPESAAPSTFQTTVGPEATRSVFARPAE